MTRERGQQSIGRGATRLVVGLAAALALGHAEPAQTADEALAGPPVRRLTNAEYLACVEQLFAPLDLELEISALPSSVDVDGFDNHIDLSTAYPSVVESYRLISAEVATRVWRDLGLASTCEASDAACIRAWLGALAAEVAWRGEGGPPLLAAFDDWRERYGLEQATRLAIQLLLLSPELTYAPRSGNLGEGPWTPLDGRAMARRLALLMWNGPPDEELLAAAASGGLADASGVEAEALRMLDDPRARDGVLRFYEQLLEWDRVASTTLDVDVYLLESPHVANDEIVPRTEEFSGEYLRFRLQPAMRAESELFVEHHLFDGAGTLAALLSASESFATWDLAELVYGATIDDSGEPVRIIPGPVEELEYPVYPVSLDPSQRQGLLSLAAFLHGHAGPVQPSPVRRGAFVMERLLCQPPIAPPDDVPPLAEPSGTEPLTNRERYAEHTNNAACQGCHEQMDAIGFTFEGYDSLGAWRTLDNGHPVDTSGALIGTDNDGPLADALELSAALAQSRTVHDCHVLNWFRYAFGRTETAADDALLSELDQRFWDSGGDVLDLLVAIASCEQFRSWRPTP